MCKKLILFSSVILTATVAFAQQANNGIDTFFLAKQKGVLGKLGKSLSTSRTDAEPVKITDPLLKFNGMIIRNVEIVAVGFNESLNDTTPIRDNYAIKIANKFHKNTRENVIRKNLFFKKGDVFLPLLVSDNERFLREQPYLRDAMIVVYKSVVSDDSVDIIVLTRDVFSIGGSLNINGIKKIKTVIKEENIGGTGNNFSISGLYERGRNPAIGIGGGFIQRNIKGSFLNFTAGFTTFSPAYNSNRLEEQSFYAGIAKPMISRYTEWTGAAIFEKNKTKNAYINDSLYFSDFQYSYYVADIWGGYNIGYGRKRLTDSEKRLRHFIAARAFYTDFQLLPRIYKDSFNFSYANLNGILFSYSLYKQNFYRTNFIYGFGRNEDVPSGINASVTTGWTNKQNRLRGYYGFDFDGTTYSKKGFFSSYTLRAGGYVGKNSFEDINVLVGIEHFTKLWKMNSTWFNRNFLSIYLTKLYNQTLNGPLNLQSIFGLPYFKNGTIAADSRSTIKFESVYFNLNKLLGFRFAPFIFSEFSFLKPTGESINKTNGYSALGGGVRTRNENLVFGTIELRGYFFPRVTPGMKNWKVELKTNLQFKYNSTFIKKPEFVIAN